MKKELIIELHGAFESGLQKKEDTEFMKGLGYDN